MKKIKLTALALAGILSISALAGCSQTTSKSSKNDPVAVVVGDTEILASEYSYYLNKAYLDLSEQHYMSMYQLPEESQYDFSYSESLEMAKEYAVEMLKETIAIKDVVASEGVKATDADYAIVNEQIATAKDQMGIQNFNQTLLSFGITEEYFIEDSLLIVLFQQVIYDIYGNASLSDEELYEIYKTDYMHAQHILIPDEIGSEEGMAAALEKANAILAEINSNPEVSFEEFIEIYDVDGGQPTAGYAFPEGYMVETFEDGVKALQPGSISEAPVESSFGYHIIKCLVPNEENFNANKELLQLGDADTTVTAVLTEKIEALEATTTSVFDEITEQNYFEYFMTAN